MSKKKTIGIFHYQVGRPDGVSLEIDKWKFVLEETGHTVHLCAGDLGTAQGTLIEEMYHHIPEIKRLNYNTFTELIDYDPQSYAAELKRWTEILTARFRNFILDKQIDFIIPQNVWCVAANPPVAIALEHARREFNLPALAHNHDFYWERSGGLALTCGAAIELADKYLPPRDPQVQHVVINSLARNELLERKGITSTLIPNVFDFDSPPWQVDEYNHDFRKAIGVKENDLLILQATRIVPRKGIELAIDFVKALSTPDRRAQLQTLDLFDGRPFTTESRIVLVLAGYAFDDTTGRYLNNLLDKARRDGVDVIHITEHIGHDRTIIDGKKEYSLWDSYVFADFVTYPSLWEGWGNQFLEAIRARLPIMLFEYPVYQADIKDKGFRVISLGSQAIRHTKDGLVQVEPAIINSAADEAITLVTNQKLRDKVVEHNYVLGVEHYSLNALRTYLHGMINV